MDVIDLLNLPINKKKLLTICEEKGCFRIINHGISREMQMEMKEAVESFFNLPESVRLHFKKLTITRISLDPSSALTELTPLLETFTIKNTAIVEEVDALCSQLKGLSPKHRYIIKAYSLKLHNLATNIACKIADSLDYKYSFEGWSGLLRPNKYNFVKESVGSVGVITHTDSGFLTILQEDESVGGLEIMDKSGSYLVVEPVPDSFIVFLGDVSKAWSNGRLHNVKHRVICKEVGLRVTIPLFITAPNDGKVETPDAFVDDDHPRLYKAFTYQDYRDIIVYEHCYGGEALSHLLHVMDDNA